MHLIESYSLQAGHRISSSGPEIYEKYFPLDIKNPYITLHTTSKPSKTYDLWPEALRELLPILVKENISVVQVGGKDDVKINNIYNTAGLANINQTAYIIKNSIGFIGCDSVCAHLAGMYKIPQVVLYSNNFIECVLPYFNDADKMILLEPDRSNGRKPCFSFQEHPKTINEIPAEKIVYSLLSLLNKHAGYNFSLEIPYSTAYVGSLYTHRNVESSNEQPVNISNLGIDSLICRYDLNPKDDILSQQLQICPCSIVTNKPIDFNLLNSFKPRIRDVNYILETSKYDISFIKWLHTNHFPYSLLTYETDIKVINSLKFSCLDYNIVNTRSQSEPPAALAGKDLSKIYFRSNIFILSNGKVYPCEAALKDGLDAGLEQNLLPVINRADFWRDSERMMFVEKIK